MPGFTEKMKIVHGEFLSGSALNSGVKDFLRFCFADLNGTCRTERPAGSSGDQIGSINPTMKEKGD